MHLDLSYDLNTLKHGSALSMINCFRLTPLSKNMIIQSDLNNFVTRLQRSHNFLALVYENAYLRNYTHASFFTVSWRYLWYTKQLRGFLFRTASYSRMTVKILTNNMTCKIKIVQLYFLCDRTTFYFRTKLWNNSNKPKVNFKIFANFLITQISFSAFLLRGYKNKNQILHYLAQYCTTITKIFNQVISM